MKSIWGAIATMLSKDTQYLPYLIALTIVLLLILLLEQISYLKKKSFLPGPTLVPPFIGSAISLVTNTKKFWDNEASLAKTNSIGISTNYLFGRFILFIYSSQLSHKVFSNIRPDAFHFLGYPFGKSLFGENSIMYMFGQDHKDLRRRIVPNFSPKALTTYTLIQQRIILKHLKSWLSIKLDEKPIPLRILCRQMNLETSETVFLGPYLSDEDRNRFNIDFNAFNMGLIKLPIDFPGFSFRKARLARRKVVKILSTCAEKSEQKMKNGEEPTCMIDFLTQENLANLILSYEEVGNLFFDFLFAAQDATTSALCWNITLLGSHPHVLQRVRQEVAKHWRPEFESSNEPFMNAEKLREMKYTEAVVKEVLRIRAPGALVPHIAGEDFQLTDNYVVPKGTVVFPSVFDSCFQGFPEPERFDPDRFMEDRQEDLIYRSNFLVFGAGAHQCVGQRYAMNYLVLFVAMFATLMDFKRADDHDGWDDGFVFAPTIFPKNDCKFLVSQRCNRG
ncbi:hypothetical protein ACH5RR_040077 [Cinchona calisaya]|uniref:sterol 22-desaturase n=1 Tax=Cinchona calisaya TaxID=153742 RepID=A0ABD2XTQ1_9GENT